MDISREQQEYRNSKPSKLGRGIERLTHPFGKALANVVPTSVVEAALKGIDEATSYPKLVEFDHETSDMAACQKAAERVVRAARAISASTGTAAGLGGVFSMSLDIPATIAIALRTIRDTGRAYGFDGNGPDEKIFRLKILELSALDNDGDRDLRIAELIDSVADDGSLRAPDHKEITPIVDQIVERVSRAVALASFRKRAGMIVPLAGAAIGGIVNSSFQNDVGRAARFAFQERRLKQDIG
ncbi:MAG: EcsC family protein [Pontixanthobacter sp.]